MALLRVILFCFFQSDNVGRMPLRCCRSSPSMVFGGSGERANDNVAARTSTARTQRHRFGVSTYNIIINNWTTLAHTSAYKYIPPLVTYYIGI